MYKDLAGFSTRLDENISATTKYFPTAETASKLLRDHLADDGDYSFLKIQDGTAIEIVKIKNYCGYLLLERGAELTSALPFRCGVSVSFTLTMQAVKDTVCQMTRC